LKTLTKRKNEINFREDYKLEHWENDCSLAEVFLPLLKSQPETQEYFIDLLVHLINDTKKTDKEKGVAWFTQLKPYITMNNISKMDATEIKALVNKLGPERIKQYLKGNWFKVRRLLGRK